MKTAIIIHGMPSKEGYENTHGKSRYNAHWLPWIKKELEQRNISAKIPDMPVPYNPEYKSWKEVFEQSEINEDTILIGHSCGGGFIVRYLSEENVKVGKVVLVAPWIDLEKRLDTGMFEFDLDKNLVSKTKGVTIFSSLNDEIYMKDTIDKILKEVENVKLVEFENMGHFCFKDMNTEEFPELLEEVLNK